MSINDTLGQVAAAHPVVGAAVSAQSVSSAILAGLQTNDPGTASLLGAVTTQASTESQLLASVTPHLGQNVNTTA